MNKLAWLFLFCITILGCSEDLVSPVEKKPPPPEIIQPKMVELKISPEGEVLPYGQKLTLIWQAKDADYCLLNGKKVDAVNSLEVGPFFKDTTFATIAVKGSLYSNPMTKIIKVGDWTTSVFGILTHSTWLEKSSIVYQNGEAVWPLDLTEEQKTIVYTFTLNRKMTGFNTAGKQTLDCDFVLLENNTRILMGDQNYLIVSVTPEKFVCRLAGTFNGKPSEREDVYVRPNK